MPWRAETNDASTGAPRERVTASVAVAAKAATAAMRQAKRDDIIGSPRDDQPVPPMFPRNRAFWLDRNCYDHCRSRNLAAIWRVPATFGSEFAYNSYMISSDSMFFLPRPADAAVAISAPGEGAGYWAGGPSAVATDDGVYLAYRLRRPIGFGRGYANAIAFARDGVHFE